MWNPNEGATPLLFAPPDRPLICRGISGGGRVRQRLTDLGILPGADLMLVGPPAPSGPVLLRVRGAQLALGRGMAAKILVSVAPSRPPRPR